MKVLVISNLYPPNIVGGYEVLCHEVATGLAERGHTITVLTSNYGGHASRFDGQAIHQALQLAVGATIYKPFDGRTSHLKALNHRNANTLRQVIAESRPDVIYVWNLYGLGRSFFDALVQSSVPFVFMLTDNWLIQMLNPKFIHSYFRKNVLSKPGKERLIKNKTRLQVSGSAFFGSAYMRDLHVAAGLVFEDGGIIHNGVQFLVDPDAQARDRSQLGADGRIKLLFAGRLVDIKGAHIAIEALAKLEAMSSPARKFQLSIVGDDRDKGYLAQLQRLAERLGCTSQITYSPPVAPDQLHKLFMEHDLYVFPSLYEPFSLTLIHALAAGIPTIASRVGGNVEIIEDGMTGLLFDRADSAGLAKAIVHLCDNAALRLSIAEQAALKAQSFTYEKMLERMQAGLMKAAGLPVVM